MAAQLFTVRRSGGGHLWRMIMESQFSSFFFSQIQPWVCCPDSDSFLWRPLSFQVLGDVCFAAAHRITQQISSCGPLCCLSGHPLVLNKSGSGTRKIKRRICTSRRAFVPISQEFGSITCGSLCPNHSSTNDYPTLGAFFSMDFLS